MNMQAHRQFGKAGWQAIMTGIYTDPAITKHAPLIEAAYAEELRRVAKAENKKCGCDVNLYARYMRKTKGSVYELGEIAKAEIMAILTDELISTPDIAIAVNRNRKSVLDYMNRLHTEGKVQRFEGGVNGGKLWAKAKEG